MSSRRGAANVSAVTGRPEVVCLMDIGNSRLKWALLLGPYRPGQPFAATGALELSALRGKGTALQRSLASFGPDLRIRACNVAGAAVERQLRAIARGAGLAAPQFVRSARAAAGVRNSYAEPWRLGADRWAALIGARSQYPDRALCLVAVGTAMTIDLLDAQGRHRGGSIIPGPQLMIDSLLKGTAGIQRRAGGRSAAQRLRTGRTGLFARDTRAAVAAGAVYAAAALITEAMRSARALLGSRPRLLVSGGAADAVAALVRAPHTREHELALRGLAVMRSELG
jgi:type III pantothenate kinase